MSLKYLREVLSPCSGLGANREEVEKALAQVEKQAQSRDQLICELRFIMAHAAQTMHLASIGKLDEAALAQSRDNLTTSCQVIDAYAHPIRLVSAPAFDAEKVKKALEKEPCNLELNNDKTQTIIENIHTSPQKVVAMAPHQKGSLHTTGLERSFVSVHSRSALEREIEMAEAIIDHEHTAFPDSTFEEGYIAALNLVMNRQGSNVREDYEAIMEKN